MLLHSWIIHGYDLCPYSITVHSTSILVRLVQSLWLLPRPKLLIYRLNMDRIMHFSLFCPFLSKTQPLQSRMSCLSHFTKEGSVWRALTDCESEVCILLSKSTCVLLSDYRGSLTFHIRRFALLHVNLQNLAGLQVKGNDLSQVFLGHLQT